MPVEKSRPLLGYVTNITPIVAPSDQRQFGRIDKLGIANWFRRNRTQMDKRYWLTTISLTMGGLHTSFAL
jgi:hypothetical protein